MSSGIQTICPLTLEISAERQQDSNPFGTLKKVEEPALFTNRLVYERSIALSPQLETKKATCHVLTILMAPTTNRYKVLDLIHLWIAGPGHFIQHKRRSTLSQDVVDEKGIL